MSLVGAAILPHNPLLVPTVGLYNHADFSSTNKGIKKIIDTINNFNIDTFIILNGHNKIIPNSFIINLCPSYNVNFFKFGDLNTNFNFQSDMATAYRLKESLETRLPISIIGEPDLDYTFGVVLNLLQEKFSQKLYIPIHSLADPNFDLTFKFGQAIVELIHKDTKRYFVIVAGDLSHANDLKKDSSTNKEYDHLLINLLKQKDFIALDSIPKNKIDLAEQCIHSPLTILAGIMSQVNFDCEINSYENKYGVGLLTCLMKL